MKQLLLYRNLVRLPGRPCRKWTMNYATYPGMDVLLCPKFPYSSGTRSFLTSALQPSEAPAISRTNISTVEAARSFPRLPVPPLKDTLTTYLKTVEPLLTKVEYQKTVEVVKSFGEGIGQQLQALLEERGRSCDNWLSLWWLRTAYLEYRDPVVVFSSPALVLPTEDFKSAEDQIRCAAKVIFGALQYKKLIDSEAIPVDRMGKISLDMSQYTKVFGTNRNPGRIRDELSFHPKSRHYVIAYKNYFYKVPAYSIDNEILNPIEILRQIKYVIRATTGLNGIPVGLLTSDRRDNWFTAYDIFRKDKVNQKSLSILEEALFTVSIDRPNRPLKNPKGTTNIANVEDLYLSDKQTVAAYEMLHGNRTNSGNRWFDKTIQFIIGTEGETGLAYEHSASEGPPIANISDFIVNNLATFGELLNNFTDKPPAYAPEILKFTVDQKVSAAISVASDRLGKLIDDLDMACFTFNNYGKAFIKSCGFSPDSFIQMAIQSAFHRLHGIPGAHYESASTRMYSGGRTETIRSCSTEALIFSKALNSASASVQEKRDAMKIAIDGHKRYAAQAVRGYGVDRHLLGLKLTAKENNIPIPELFSDAGYLKSTYYRLSTSQVPSTNRTFMCYGPLVRDGYACCYNPRSQDISFGVSAFHSANETSAERFKISLQEVLLDMKKLAVENIQSKL